VKLQADTTLTDSDKISQIIQLFFAAKEANFKDDGAGVDLSAFISNDDNFNHNKIVNFANLSREGRKIAGLEIVSDNLTLTINKITHNENDATVNLTELYTYQIASLSDQSCYRFYYNVYMTKEDGSWLITKIDTNDEAYTNDLGSDSFDVDRTLQNGLAMIKAAPTTNNFLPKTPGPANSNDAAALQTSFYPMNRSDAAAYVFKYALTYNSDQFISWASSGGDCADFGSQCVWYGLGGRDLSPTGYKPSMNALWHMASDGNPYTSSFISMGSFYAMINTDYPTTTPHLSGDCYVQGSIADAAPGDIIQIYNGSNWFHTYVVYSVSGLAGSRMPSDIQICAHTADLQNINFYTQWAQGHPNAYRLIKINGAYY
jgi:hypothetical protein